MKSILKLLITLLLLISLEKNILAGLYLTGSGTTAKPPRDYNDNFTTPDSFGYSAGFGFRFDTDKIKYRDGDEFFKYYEFAAISIRYYKDYFKYHNSIIEQYGLDS